MQRLAWVGLITIASGEAAAERVRTPYDPGRFEIKMGFYRQSGEVRGVRAGGGFFVLRGVELGIVGLHFWGSPADVEGVAPFFKVLFTPWYDAIPIVPYLTTSYEHRWTAPNYYVPDSLVMSAGLELTVPTNDSRFPVIFGGGVVWDHPVNGCSNYGCDHVASDHFGPEVFVSVGF